MLGFSNYSRPCVPKELRQTYDLLKLQEKQDEKERESKKKDDEMKVELNIHNANKEVITYHTDIVV